jgi:IS30 family transposase
MHDYFAPVFAAAPDDPTEEVKQYLPVAVREKVRALIADGKRAPTIAKECGVSPMTVYREMGRYDY